MQKEKGISFFRVVSEKNDKSSKKELILKTPSSTLIGFVAFLVVVAIVTVFVLTIGW